MNKKNKQEPSTEALWERAYKREKIAREKSELLLENSTRELYQTNQALEKDIAQHKATEEKLALLNAQLVIASRRAGISEIGTEVLHNIGNILSSVNTSISLLSNKITNSSMNGIVMLTQLLKEHEDDWKTFLIENPQGQLLPKYLSQLAKKWTDDKNYLLEEVMALDKNIQYIREIIERQNFIASTQGTTEEFDLSDLIEDALALNRVHYERTHVEIICNFAPIKKVIIDRVKLLQIITNLIKNSIDAIIQNNSATKRITVSIQESDATHCMIQVQDTGIGILPENIAKIFSYGFTTKTSGHGFGLHSSALFAQEMGGNLSAKSEGISKGATFTLILPLQNIPSKR